MDFTLRHRLYIVGFVVVVATFVIVFLYPDNLTRTSADRVPSSTVPAGGSSGMLPQTRGSEFTTAPAVSTPQEETAGAPVATSPDGTPLSSGAPEELFPELGSTTPPTSTEPPVSTVALPNYGPLDRAEAFVEEYFTYFEIDTFESWKTRVAVHVTDTLAEQLTFIDVEEGIGLRANVEPIDEGVGEVSDVAADFTIRVVVEKYVDGVSVAEQPLIMYVKLQGRSDSWLVSSYQFNE